MMTAHQTGTALNCHNLRSLSLSGRKTVETQSFRFISSAKAPERRKLVENCRDFVIHGWEPPSIQPWRYYLRAFVVQGLVCEFKLQWTFGSLSINYRDFFHGFMKHMMGFVFY
ncbi:hypothetical protein TNIN_70461 [Trichonephila inaurata madagascariensis]|uniref:Uncharacterized protein n=1 Tax=Trichonephila inaurata madagascariensis TaxID=2747483 RepID=A0A8X6XXZ6_9ARAC|nr:hypothetical protein TNIN_70461 [Trichonephila inaurata madagascariensis]